MPRRLFLPLLLTLLLLPTVAPAAESTPIEAFYGQYEGQAISHSIPELAARDLSVRIYPAGDAFAIDWTTVIHKQSGKQKSVSYSITFAPSNRPNTYGSAMRKNLFGGWVPLDPLKGDPYVWARLRHSTLSVYALIITDEGDYEIQTYNRTLAPGGLTLEFERFRNGEALQSISGTLKRVGD